MFDVSQAFHLFLPGIIKFFHVLLLARLHHGGDPHHGIPMNLRENGSHPTKGYFSLHLGYLHANLMLTEKLYATQSVTCCDLGRVQMQVVAHLTLLFILVTYTFTIGGSVSNSRVSLGLGETLHCVSIALASPRFLSLKETCYFVFAFQNPHYLQHLTPEF